jgi:hypothetical protein
MIDYIFASLCIIMSILLFYVGNMEHGATLMLFASVYFRLASKKNVT